MCVSRLNGFGEPDLCALGRRGGEKSELPDFIRLDPICGLDSPFRRRDPRVRPRTGRSPGARRETRSRTARPAGDAHAAPPPAGAPDPETFHLYSVTSVPNQASRRIRLASCTPRFKVNYHVRL